MSLSKLHRANAAVLATLLATVSDEQYDHNEIFDDGPKCAAAHGRANPELFKCAVPREERSLLDRLLGRNASVPLYSGIGIGHFVSDAFGEDSGMWPAVFTCSAFAPVAGADVTRSMVIDRLNDIASGKLKPVARIPA